MAFIFLCGFCTIIFLALIGCLKMQSWESGSRMINADWLDPSVKFNFIARWGA